jgi:hypothetical protein
LSSFGCGTSEQASKNSPDSNLLSSRHREGIYTSWTRCMQSMQPRTYIPTQTWLQAADTSATGTPRNRSITNGNRHITDPAHHCCVMNSQTLGIEIALRHAKQIQADLRCGSAARLSCFCYLPQCVDASMWYIMQVQPLHSSLHTCIGS